MINYLKITSKKWWRKKAEMLRKYLDDLGNPLIFLPYCGYTMATFKFYSYDDNDGSLRLYYTFSNLGDLESQLYYFWIQLNHFLKGNWLSYYDYKISYVTRYKNVIWAINKHFILSSNSCCIYSLLLFNIIIENYLYINKYMYKLCTYFYYTHLLSY